MCTFIVNLTSFDGGVEAAEFAKFGQTFEIQ